MSRWYPPSEVSGYNELAALPQWCVLRTAQGVVIERTEYDVSWDKPGSESSHHITDGDFPARVLWTYAEEVE